MFPVLDRATAFRFSTWYRTAHDGLQSRATDDKCNYVHGHTPRYEEFYYDLPQNVNKMVETSVSVLLPKKCSLVLLPIHDGLFVLRMESKVY